VAPPAAFLLKPARFLSVSIFTSQIKCLPGPLIIGGSSGAAIDLWRRGVAQAGAANAAGRSAGLRRPWPAPKVTSAAYLGSCYSARWPPQQQQQQQQRRRRQRQASAAPPATWLQFKTLAR